MLIYRLFNGKEFDNEKEYNEVFKKLVNEPITSFNTEDLNNYINEYFPSKFESIEILKTNKEYQIYDFSKDTPYLKITALPVEYGICISIELIMNYNDICDSKLNLSTQFILNSEIKLKNFQTKVFKYLKSFLERCNEIL